MSYEKTFDQLEREKFDDYSSVSIKVTPVNSFITSPFDTISVDYPTTSTEVYIYTLAGSSVGSVQVTFSDATKGTLLEVKRL